MPKPMFPIQGIYESIQRPVVLDIIRQIIEWSGSDTETTIQLTGETDRTYQPGTTLTKKEFFNSFGSDNKWTVTFKENTQIDRVLSTAVFHDDNQHIFFDGGTRTYIRPINTATDNTLTIKARFTDRDKAIRWRDHMRARISANFQHKVHDVSYSYLIPEECIYILKEIHRLRENVAGYNQDFQTYYLNHTTKRRTTLANLSGTATAEAIAETQTKVLGYFNFEAEPEEGEKDSENSAWYISFDYEFKYDRPSQCLMEYPIMIHNQLLSSKYRQTEPVQKIEDKQLSYSISSRLISSFEKNINTSTTLPGVGIPNFDEFVPRQIPPDTIRMITALVSIDENNYQNILNLNDFGKFSIDPEIIQYMIQEHRYLNVLDKCPINVCMYRFEQLISLDQIEITENLLLRTKFIPSMREIYHVRVSVHKNPKMMDLDTREKLRHNYNVAKKIFLSLRPDLESQNLPGPALPGNIMTRKDFNACIDFIDKEYTTKKGQFVQQFNTVMNLIITPDRRN